MKLLRPARFFLPLCAAVSSLIAAEEEPIVIEALEPGAAEFKLDTEVAIITNRFVIRYKGAVLTAQKGRMDGRSGEITAEGEVVLQNENAVWRGERIEYNLRTKLIKTDEFRTGRTPFFATGQGLAADLTNKTYTATNTFVTTDDVEEPGYRVRAKPDDRPRQVSRSAPRGSLFRQGAGILFPVLSTPTRPTRQLLGADTGLQELVWSVHSGSVQLVLGREAPQRAQPGLPSQARRRRWAGSDL